MPDAKRARTVALAMLAAPGLHRQAPVALEHRGSEGRRVRVRDRRPRVTYIHQHFRRPDQAGGSRPYEFASRLSRAGWDVTVICAGPEARSYEVGDVRVCQLSVSYRNDMSFARRILAFARFSALATFRAVGTPADVVFASSTPLSVAVPALATHAARRVPMVFEVRDLWPAVPISLGLLKNPVAIRSARLLERLAYRHSSAVVGLSPAMCDGVLSTAPTADVHLIPNTAQPERFTVTDARRQAVRRELGLRENEVLVTYAGSLGRSYNPGWLIRLGASKAARSIGLRVMVIGQGAQLEELRSMADRVGLDSRTVVPGPLAKTRVAEIYAASQLVASCLVDDPSLADNSLNKVFDAYAASRPLIFNHGGWLSTLTQAEGAGWRLSDEPEEAGSQLLALLGGEDLAAAGARSYTLGRRDFDVDRAAESLHGILHRTLHGSPRR